MFAVRLKCSLFKGHTLICKAVNQTISAGCHKANWKKLFWRRTPSLFAFLKLAKKKQFTSSLSLVVLGLFLLAARGNFGPNFHYIKSAISPACPHRSPVSVRILHFSTFMKHKLHPQSRVIKFLNTNTREGLGRSEPRGYGDNFSWHCIQITRNLIRYKLLSAQEKSFPFVGFHKTFSLSLSLYDSLLRASNSKAQSMLHWHI